MVERAATAGIGDSLYRLAQIGDTTAVRLVRLNEVVEANRYRCTMLEFDGGSVQAGQDELVVTNLAEPSDAAGTIAGGTDAVAIDVEGRWVVFVRPAVSASFVARVVQACGGALYTVREQAVAADGQLQDAQGAVDVTACNLAELSLGGGAAVDEDTRVLVLALAQPPAPASLRYVFDHPVYAKYLE